jgi:hypothetical protein
MTKHIHIHVGKKTKDASSPQLESIKAQLLGIIRDVVRVERQNPGSSEAKSLVQYRRQAQQLAKKIG